MTRLCTVCAHPKRQEIDVALMLHSAPYRVLAGRYGLRMSSLQRHEQSHLRSTLQHSQELQAMLSATNLREELGKWHKRMKRQYRNADAQGDVMATVATARVGIAAIESFHRIMTEGDVTAADPVGVQPPTFEPNQLRFALKTLIEAGVAMPRPGDADYPTAQENPGNGQDATTDDPATRAS
jgi:hypothetical protein